MNIITIVINIITLIIGCALTGVGIVKDDNDAEIKGLLIMILSTLILMEFR